MERGRLKENHFTIIIRTPKTLDGQWLTNSLEKISGGFYNFYYLQRFGSPRLISHILGKLLLRQEYEKVIKTLLCSNGVQDIPLLKGLRLEACTRFGKDWQHVKKTFLYLPYTFRQELEVLDYLTERPTDYLGALKLIKQQSTFWVYSYASYLYNLHLSHVVQTDREPLKEAFPLLLNPAWNTIPTYEAQLKKDGIENLERALIPIFGYNPINSKNVCRTKAPVTIGKTEIVKKAIILTFDLPTGAYATTFLTHLFTIYRGLPLPKWLDITKYDSKGLLGTGSVAKVEDILGEYMFSQVIRENINNK